jgi:hypothetical protein
MSVLAQMLLAGMITLVMLLVARPIRRMWQMTELAVGAVGGALPASPPGVLTRLRRHRAGVEATPSERFWEEARGTEADSSTADSVPGSRWRPEAGAPMVAAERLDRRGGAPAAVPVLGPGGLGGSGRGDSETALTGSSESAPWPDRLAALPAGFSVTAAGRARTGGDPVYVPSAVSDPRGAPRQAELEEVAGRPVWVVYRPSAGLEVGSEVGLDGTDGDSSRTTG